MVHTDERRDSLNGLLLVLVVVQVQLHHDFLHPETESERHVRKSNGLRFHSDSVLSTAEVGQRSRDEADREEKQSA